jgi:hypothetical protein
MQTAQGSIFGLWGEFLGTLFPLTLLIIASVFDPQMRERFQKQKLFLISYALFPALFFTFFPYRVNTYLYLLTPVIAWLVLERPTPKKSIQLILFALSALFCIAALVFLYRLASGGWIAPLTAIAAGITLMAWSYGHFKMRGQFIAIASLILVCLFRFAGTDIGEWDLQPLRAAHASSYAYRIDVNQEDIWHEFGLISTAIGQPISRVRNESEAKAFTDQGGALILSDEQTAFSGASCDPWRRLKRRMKFPIQKLIFEGLSIDDPELHRIFQICRAGKD